MAVTTTCPTLLCFDAGLASIPPAALSRFVSSVGRTKPDILLNRAIKLEVSTAAGTIKSAQCRFLSLPLEIRLQVYNWLYRMSPVQKATPNTGYPLPTRQQRITTLVEDEEDFQHSSYYTTSVRHLLRQDRLYNYMPSELLRLNRQIYAEAREIPFHSNEFVFENWFSSGLVTGAAVISGIFEPWQTRAMRFARIETRDVDFRQDAGLEAWKTLSGCWAEGLRGLRVLIQVSKEDVPGDGEMVDLLDGVPEQWVSKGCLDKLLALEQLEIELVTPSLCSEGVKLGWCRKLERILDNNGSSAAVVCVKNWS